MTYQEQTAAYKAGQRAQGETARFLGRIVTVHNWSPEHLYAWEGWVTYAPYWPGGGLHPAGYFVPENSAEPRDAVQTYLEVRNTGTVAVTVTVHANPTHPYTYTAPAGQTLKVGPFVLYASNGGFGFRCTPATGVQVRVLKDAAPAGLGINPDRSVAPPSTTYSNP